MSTARRSLISLLVLAGLALGTPAMGAADRDDPEACPNVRGFKPKIDSLEAHEAWVENEGWIDPSVPGQGNFCNANMSGRLLSGKVLKGANLMGADLREADLTKADLRSADLQGANLESALLSEAKLQLADLRGAVLTEADLAKANLNDADLSAARLWDIDAEGSSWVATDLTGADLRLAELQGSCLHQTILTGARLYGVDLTGARFEVAEAPNPVHLAQLRGLRSLVFNPGEVSGLAQLRRALATAGLRGLEREATYALERGRTRHALAGWQSGARMDQGTSSSNDTPDPSAGPDHRSCRDATLDPPAEPSHLARLEGALRLVFFEWTSGYGLFYGRPIWLLIALIGLGSLIYVVPIRRGADRTERRAGIYKVWSPDRIGPEGQDEPEPLHVRGYTAFLYALYFSVLAGFHFGWRDLNVGNWIARVQLREYSLRATGWVRVISGIQSLLCIYLLALWALSYFGRPFG